MGEWVLASSDLKKYPHFDSPISADKAQTLATDSNSVATHKFYPFIRYVQRWNRFAEKGDQGDPKARPIRYAARRDAYIFSYYRHILSERYEAELRRLGLSECILAYRRLIDPLSGGGKCNIHFARDAFAAIKSIGNCSVIALDISGYFESLDHTLLKQFWCRLLGVKRLPADHFQVFKAITKYAVVDKQAAYERLGYFGPKTTARTGKTIKGYLRPYHKIPQKLCSDKEFREKIAGKGAQRTIIQKHFLSYGIPQGAPISDLLANVYLLDFDQNILAWAKARGGIYLRYSDDILIVVPGDEAVGRDFMEKVRDHIKKHGDQLVIKQKKSSLFVFKNEGNYQSFKLVHGTQGRNGLEYLGFRYDGKRVFLRDATVSNLYRKIARAARGTANNFARRYPGKSLSYLKTHFNYEKFVKRFGRVERFEENYDNCRKWTFWTYATRAAEVFGPLGVPIFNQLKKHRKHIHARLEKELARAVMLRDT